MTVGEQGATRFALTFIIAIAVISSPLIMVTNPTQVLAATNSNRVDSSSFHSTPLTSVPMTSSSTPATAAPPVSDQSGDFTTQAALSLTRAAQTSNFVASKAYYDISFRTATAGVIKSVVMDFPAGTAVGSALIVEAVGIGPGTLAASAGEVLTYTVTNAVNVPALTNIRIQISNINNPPTPSGSFTVTITTRDPAFVAIDGPTATSAYNMVQVGNAQIAPGAVTTTKIATGAVTSGDLSDGSVTSTKPAESYEKRVTVLDDTAGQALGWNPDGATTVFTINDADVGGFNSAFISVVVIDFAFTNYFCDTVFQLAGPGRFTIKCSSPPAGNSQLHYLLTNLPEHVVT